MGIVDNIKKRMGGAEDAYDDAYNDDGYYSESFGSYEEPEDMNAPADNTMSSDSVSTGTGTGLGGMNMGGMGGMNSEPQRSSVPEARWK